MTWTGRLQRVLTELPNETAQELERHLLAKTPAEKLADLLNKHGHQISASTIRSQRRARGI